MKAPAVSHRLGSHTADTRKPKTGNTMRTETVYMPGNKSPSLPNQKSQHMRQEYQLKSQIV